jgi:hypothetical protein
MHTTRCKSLMPENMPGVSWIVALCSYNSDACASTQPQLATTAWFVLRYSDLVLQQLYHIVHQLIRSHHAAALLSLFNSCCGSSSVHQAPTVTPAGMIPSIVLQYPIKALRGTPSSAQARAAWFVTSLAISRWTGSTVAAVARHMGPTSGSLRKAGAFT